MRQLAQARRFHLRLRLLTPARLIVALTAAGVGALVVVAYEQASPRGLVARKGTLVSAAAGPARQDSVSQVQELSVVSSSGLVVSARLRVPQEPHVSRPAAVLVGGIEVGRRVVTARGFDTIARTAVMVGMDYPLGEGELVLQGWGALATLARIRPAAYDAVAGALLLIDYLQSRPDVDRARLFLVGGSMGAPVVTIAGAVDSRPAAVVALYGGGRLGSTIAHTLRHPNQPRPFPPWQAVMTGYGIAWLLAPLEPTRYVDRIAPRPYLMINGASDSLIPRDNVLALYEAARPPKELIWVEGEHVHPDAAGLLTRLAETATAWLTERGLLRAIPTPSHPGGSGPSVR